MRCSKCSAENREGRRFCAECGAPLNIRCRSCGAENELAEKFCGECGVALAGKTQAGSAKTPSAQSITPEIRVTLEQPDAIAATSATASTWASSESADGERRHLTVLFCDLAGSTGLSASLDPEDWRATVAAYHRAAASAITRFGGHVAKYLGDGVMAFFGYPEAHDNDAERAVRAGLAILDALIALNESSAHPLLAARIGIDSGPVVVGIGAGPDADVFGDTPNIAARVQAAAAPNTVVVTAATYHLIPGLFIVEDRGTHPLKGIAKSLQLYRIIRPSAARGRLEATATLRGLTSFVGRDDELRSLAHRWERACEGEGQVALIIGEAGIGKSRLLHRFRETLTDTPHTWIDTAAGAFFQNTPFYPVTEMLRQVFFAGGNGGPNEIAQIAVALAHAGLNPAATIPLLAPMLNLPLPPEYPPSPLPPDQQRRRLLATLVEWILASARIRPLIIATEDLHWIDPSTLELIQLLVEQSNAAPLMLLYTARPEFRPPWPLRSHHAQINLNRLSARDVRTIVAQVAAQKALADETVSAVVERTGGVPLFVEEITRALLERGADRPTGREIPATLHDSLIARLDRLGPARETLQLGAVLGSGFSYELLHAVHPSHDHDELQRHLRALTDAELLYVRGLAPDAAYQFKHALIRDAAYEALLKSRRKELHRLVAQTIDSQFATLKENHPEVLARHWTEAGELESAISEWKIAGDSAIARNAFTEGLEIYRQKLALLQLLPESKDRDHRELDIRTTIVRMLQIVRGWSSQEAIEAIESASALAENIGDLTQLANWLGSRAFAAWISGNLSAALKLAERSHELRLRLGNKTGLAYSHLMQLMTRYWLGDLGGANDHYEAGAVFFDDPVFRRDPVGSALAAFAFGSWTAWQLGYADTARQRLDLMRAATSNSNLHEMSFAGHHEADFWSLTREYQQAEGVALRTLELSEKHNFSDGVARSQCILGYARAQSGHLREGIAIIRQGLDSLNEIGSPLRAPYYMATMADAQRLAGQLDEAIATAEQALATNPEQLSPRPEIIRIRGEIHLKLGHPELAETDLRDAIALAQSMNAKAFELRASTSLGRLLASTNHRAEAYTMLSAIYNWFTEGFDTADLKDAKSLLDELTS